MKYLTEKIQKPTSWNLLYADDFALISDSIYEIQERVICDPKMPIRTKGKVYKTVVTPILLCGSETWASKKVHKQKLHTTEMRMLRWAGGVALKDKVRNEHVSFKIVPITEKITESRRRWYGHVMCRPDDHIVKKCLSIATKRRGRGRPQITWMTNVRKDMQ
ncbi:unnamed protein product [Euphydryas editha]|uniref:Reverse transcriptase domain-containing protein n=1 Tax=Euphydryas editha TaxID=104508 RepID=A0AAU9V432_EUPED|nr:unnamed protein product [Euphydryas editha]